MGRIYLSFVPIILLLLHPFETGLVASVSNIATDQLALLVFKSTIITSDPQNAVAANWSTTATSVCNWIGVSCNGQHRRVTALNLPKMGLGGIIPPDLGNLSFLVSLNLSRNSFRGQLPKELGKLRRLKFMDLSNNHLSGKIPSWSDELLKLQVLNLGFNSFTGNIPDMLFNMSNLDFLSISNNVIQGKIPREIGQLSNLKTLRMGNNHLSGTLPSAIYNMSSLQEIDFSYNNITGIIPDDMCDFLPKLNWISFSSNELHGQLPSKLENCRELEVLSLSYNKFTGQIPKSIGNVTKLKELFLGYTSLEGEIPDDIVNLSNLRILYVGETFGLRGEIPWEIGKLMSLEVFYAVDLGLTGPIPPSISNISSLKRIWLSNNNLSGEIPRAMGNLHNLEVLSFRQNKLSGLLPSTIFNISTMKKLAVDDNFLSGQLPSTTGLRLPNLEELYVWGNNLSGIIPNSISNASNLRLLDMGPNRFSGHIPSTLGNLKFLEILNLPSNRLTTPESSSHECSIISSLENCTSLKYLILSANPLNCILPPSIGNLSKSLLVFDASNSQLKGHIPKEIGNLGNLIKLDLSGNELNGSIPTTIGRLQNLQGLSLSESKLQGHIPFNVCHLKRLYTLSFYSNDLYGPIPTCLSNLTSLRYLSFASNKFSSTIPSALWSLNYLLELNLSSNSLSGSLPFGIGNLKVLIKIDLSRNHLSGVLPSIGELKDLSYLSVADNSFQGNIPQSFGSLTSLEVMNISENNLSGTIPKTLGALTHLKQLDVSFNMLEGEIPGEGPFANFSAQSFRGNYALCGSPRMQVPPCKKSTILRSRKASSNMLKYILPAIVTTILVILAVVIFIRRTKLGRKQPNQENSAHLATWRRVSYLELQRATDDFSESNLLGVGAFGSVYKGSLSDGMNVAIKVFNLQLEEAFKSFEVECDILRNIRHRNLVKIITGCSNPDFKALVLDFMPNGSLEKWLYSHNCFLDILQRLNIMIDVASVLEYLHQGHPNSMVHCDLKPSNVLLDEDKVGHVGDFGIAKLLGEGKSVTETITLATIGYMAPEYGAGGFVSPKCDIYSYGILLMETFTRKKPTDEMFSGELTLKQWVKYSLSRSLMEVVDGNLLKREEEHFIPKAYCISSILGLALDCSAESPEDRQSIQDVLVNMRKIKEIFLKV